ncbi:MAG: ribosome-associated translation inhibitor RaiA [Bacteroidales bacterium]|nr:ribosome-associated translation inhibitor RaiA [Bacteroidales bacterium]
MNINIQSLKFKAADRLIDFINDKIERLTKHLPQEATSVDVVLKLEQDHEQGNKIVDVRLNVPGHELFASKQAKTFEEACLEACDALKNQIEKIKKH